MHPENPTAKYIYRDIKVPLCLYFLQLNFLPYLYKAKLFKLYLVLLLNYLLIRIFSPLLLFYYCKILSVKNFNVIIYNVDNVYYGPPEGLLTNKDLFIYLDNMNFLRFFLSIKQYVCPLAKNCIINIQNLNILPGFWCHYFLSYRHGNHRYSNMEYY